MGQEERMNSLQSDNGTMDPKPTNLELLFAEAERMTASNSKHEVTFFSRDQNQVKMPASMNMDTRLVGGDDYSSQQFH